MDQTLRVTGLTVGHQVCLVSITNQWPLPTAASSSPTYFYLRPRWPSITRNSSQESEIPTQTCVMCLLPPLPAHHAPSCCPLFYFFQPLASFQPTGYNYPHKRLLFPTSGTPSSFFPPTELLHTVWIPETVTYLKKTFLSLLAGALQGH